MAKKKPIQQPHIERKSSLAYRMNSRAYQDLMRRCKGKIIEAKKEILRGLCMPESFKEIVKIDNQTNQIKEILIQASYIDELVDIFIVD